jgi:hypothetical protein
MKKVVYESLANLLAHRAISKTHSNQQEYTGDRKDVYVEFTGLYNKKIPNEVFEQLQDLKNIWMKEHEENKKDLEYLGGRSEAHHNYLRMIDEINEEYAKLEITYICGWDDINLKELFSIPELKEKILEAFKSVGWDDDLGTYDTMDPHFDLERNRIIFKIHKFTKPSE